MKSWEIAAIVLAGLCMLGLLGYIYLLKQNHRAEQNKLRRMADQKYREGRSEAAELLRAAVDQIASDQAQLQGMTEKELMMEAMKALSGLGRRMDRMEDSLRSVSQFDDKLSAINEQAGILSTNAELLSSQMTALQDASSGFRASVDSAGEAVYSLSDSTSSIEQLLPDVKDHLVGLEALSEELQSMRAHMDPALQKVNSLLKVTEENPAATLVQMDSRLGSLYSQLENLAEGLNLMAESLEGIQEKLEKNP